MTEQEQPHLAPAMPGFRRKRRRSWLRRIERLFRWSVAGIPPERWRLYRHVGRLSVLAGAIWLIVQHDATWVGASDLLFGCCVALFVLAREFRWLRRRTMRTAYFLWWIVLFAAGMLWTTAHGLHLFTQDHVVPRGGLPYHHP